MHTMKVPGRQVSWQVVHADLRKKLSWKIPHTSSNPYLNNAIFNFHIKKFCEHAKNHEDQETLILCFKTFMVHGNSILQVRKYIPGYILLA